jgi:hypothetical protein
MMHPMASTALIPRSRSDPARVYAGTQTTRPIHSAATSAAVKERFRAPTGIRSAFARSGDGDAGGRATIGSSRKPDAREDHDVFVGSSDAASSSSSSSVANHVVHDARVRRDDGSRRRVVVDDDDGDGDGDAMTTVGTRRRRGRVGGGVAVGRAVHSRVEGVARGVVDPVRGPSARIIVGEAAAAARTRLRRRTNNDSDSEEVMTAGARGVQSSRYTYSTQ